MFNLDESRFALVGPMGNAGETMQWHSRDQLADLGLSTGTKEADGCIPSCAARPTWKSRLIGPSLCIECIGGTGLADAFRFDGSAP
jgi:hypothetical protein